MLCAVTTISVSVSEISFFNCALSTLKSSNVLSFNFSINGMSFSLTNSLAILLKSKATSQLLSSSAFSIAKSTKTFVSSSLVPALAIKLSTASFSKVS